MANWFYNKEYGLINLDRYDRITRCQDTIIFARDVALPYGQDGLEIDEWRFDTKEEMQQVYNQIKKKLMENKGR